MMGCPFILHSVSRQEGLLGPGRLRARAQDVRQSGAGKEQGLGLNTHGQNVRTWPKEEQAQFSDHG